MTNQFVRKGSLTLVGILFLSLVSVIISFQLISYRNQQQINHNLMIEYSRKRLNRVKSKN